MSPRARTILADVTLAYGHSKERYEQAMGRGHQESADEYMSEMQEIERCVDVKENSTSWRKTIGDRLRREARR